MTESAASIPGAAVVLAMIWAKRGGSVFAFSVRLWLLYQRTWRGIPFRTTRQPLGQLPQGST